MNRTPCLTMSLAGACVLCLFGAFSHGGERWSSGAFTGYEEFGTGSTIPMAWGDFDNDGDLDLAVGNYFGEDNELYVNEGDGTFTQRIEFGAGNTFALVWADFDNDGDLDMAVGNSGQNRLYVNLGDGSFDPRDEFGISTTVSLAWGDVDNDGDLDLAVGNGILGSSQQNYLYVNGGDGSFAQQAEFGGLQTDSLAWADYDHDGDLDLAVGNGGFTGEQTNYLYINDGDLTFTKSTAFGEGDTATVAWADADNDGRIDIAVGNWNGGQSYLYLNQSDGTFAEYAAFGTHDTNTLAWGDYDHDGDLDVALGNGDFGTAEQNSLYVNDGTGVFTKQDEFGIGSTDALAWGDYDGDGDIDLAAGNEHSPRQNELWVNELNDESYLQLSLIGRFHSFGECYSNRGGIGAKVSIYPPGHLGEADFLLGFQQMEAKGGFSTQNSMVLTFGVPDGEIAVDVEINWPGSGESSITQRIYAVGIGQLLVVLETKPGDVDGSGEVDVLDLLQLLGAWGPCSQCDDDLDGDGVVDVLDLLVMLASWGPCS